MPRLKLTDLPAPEYLMRLAREAGDIMRTGFRSKHNTVWKRDATPVTTWDKKINRLVITRFKKDFPHIGVLGEEGSRKVDSEFLAVLDPIDGTIPFMAGLALFTFCLSILKNGRPVVALIYNPITDNLWYAEEGKGTEMNGRQVHVSDKKTLKNETINTIWWKKCRYDLGPVCDGLMRRRVIWMNPAAVAIGAGTIASSQMVASMFGGHTAWEAAAMELVVKEAGGYATDLFGNELVYRSKKLEVAGHIMSNGHVHSELLDVFRKCYMEGDD